MEIPAIINGGYSTDHRGTISYVNDFDMSSVKRFYIITHPDVETVRGWRAHKIEQRWFHVTEGEFLIKLVKIDNWESPDKNLFIQEFMLTSNNIQTLCVPAGYGSLIRATKEKSKIIVFADYGIENANLDDYVYPSDYFDAHK
ncbi:WxcM-like domain-containing protein [Pedobacter steynii]